MPDPKVQRAEVYLIVKRACEAASRPYNPFLEQRFAMASRLGQLEGYVEELGRLLGIPVNIPREHIHTPAPEGECIKTH